MTDEPIEQQEEEQSHVSDILQAWQDIGEGHFADGETIVVPKIKAIRASAELFAIDVALTVRNGNLTHAANDLGTSRRSIREKLKAANRYPWNPIWPLGLTVS
jgi:DNA-binding NtrC family response regulator